MRENAEQVPCTYLTLQIRRKQFSLRWQPERAGTGCEKVIWWQKLFSSPSFGHQTTLSQPIKRFTLNRHLACQRQGFIPPSWLSGL